MADSQNHDTETAKMIFELLEESDSTFQALRANDASMIERNGKLSGLDADHARVVDAAVSQLIAALGPDIEHAFVLSNKELGNASEREYEFVAFSDTLMAEVKFNTVSADPVIIVTARPRRSLVALEVRGARNYQTGKGSLAVKAHYSHGGTLFVRASEPKWLDDLLPGLRRDLAL